jgi:hypothetical protein
MSDNVDERISKLGARFLPNEVLIRTAQPTEFEGKPHARPMFYMDRTMVINRLNEVLGHEAWTDEYKQVGNGVICKLSINLGTLQDERWYSKEDGAGESDIEGEKGAYTGALKRAANKWGMGMYLYTEFKDKDYLPGSFVGNNVRLTDESEAYCREVLWDDWYLSNEPGAKGLVHLYAATTNLDEAAALLRSNKDLLAVIIKNPNASAAFRRQIEKHKTNLKGK